MAANLYDLAETLGRGSVIAAATFVAYVVGVLLTLSTSPLTWLTNRLDKYLSEEVAQTRRQYSDLLQTTFATVAHADWDKVDEVALYESNLAMDIGVGSTTELRPRLLAANQQMYGEYDRLEAEASFRLNVCPPLIALGASAGAQVSWWWLWVTLVVCGGLTYRGVVSHALADTVVRRAVLSGIVEHPLQTILRRTLKGVSLKPPDPGTYLDLAPPGDGTVLGSAPPDGEPT